MYELCLNRSISQYHASMVPVAAEDKKVSFQRVSYVMPVLIPHPAAIDRGKGRKGFCPSMHSLISSCLSGGGSSF